MRNPGLMAVPLLLEACAPTSKVLPNEHRISVEMRVQGAEFEVLCAGNGNGLEELADARTRYFLNNGLVKALKDDLSAWECTPVLSGGGVVTRLETSFRDSNGTVWVVDMTPTTDAKEDLSASLK